MKTRNYIKKKGTGGTAEELIAEELRNSLHKGRVSGVLRAAVLFCVIVSAGYWYFGVKDLRSIPEYTESMPVLAPSPMAAAASKKDLISIPAGVVKANPFLPYRNIDKPAAVEDVPKFELIEPPEEVNVNSDAARVMDTIVSGILYDKYSPSAILNIEGSDYLVKKGDVINNYKVLNITQNSVSVQLGSNVYNAGLGEMLTEGTINHNEVSNLSKKFGGER